MSKIVLSIIVLLMITVIGSKKDQGFLFDTAIFPIFTLTLLVIGIFFFVNRYLKTTEGIIFLMQKKLNRQISDNYKELEILKSKIGKINHKMFIAKEIDSAVKEIVLDNIDLWEAQIDIHRRIIILCEKKILKLAQNRREIRLLRELLKQVQGEPNSSEKIDQLQNLLQDIDLKLNDKIDKDINDLVSSIKTDSRRSNIVKMHIRLMNIEREAIGFAYNTVESDHAAVMKKYNLIENGVEYREIRTDIEEHKKAARRLHGPLADMLGRGNEWIN